MDGSLEEEEKDEKTKNEDFFFFFFRLFFGCWVLEQLFLKADAAGSSIKNWGYHYYYYWKWYWLPK